MTPRQIRIAQLLTYSGTLPLIGCGALTLANGASPRVDFFAVSYGAIIAAFLCGIHWAAYLFFAEKCPRNLLLTSNAVALLAWASLLAWPAPEASCIQPLCFLYLLLLDWRLHRAEILPTWFYALRRNATIIVIMALLTMMGAAN